MEAKQELLKRYIYLYENNLFILSPHVKINLRSSYPTIKISKETIKLLEDFLFSETVMEETNFYKFNEGLKNSQEHLLTVKRGIKIIKDYEEKTKREVVRGILEILNQVNSYLEIELQKNQNKLSVLDEYYCLARYKNDGKIRISGRQLSIHDVNAISIPIKKQIKKETVKESETNKFIENIISYSKNDNNHSIFTETEKQNAYLLFHDELPWNLEVTCKSYQDENLIKPSITKPCLKNFYLKESQIFKNELEGNTKYYQLCPHCGYIVNIDETLLPTKIIERIETKCLEDPYLLRKKILYSELKQLEDIPVKSLKKERRF